MGDFEMYPPKIRGVKVDLFLQILPNNRLQRKKAKREPIIPL